VSDVSGSCPALGFTIDGKDYRTSLLTIYLDTSCDKIKKGTNLTVTSVLQTAGWSLATIVKKASGA
jgi:hypothetical protein